MALAKFVCGRRVRLSRRAPQNCNQYCSVPLAWKRKKAHYIRSFLMLTTQRSMQQMLRWMQRGIVMILITANLATVVLAEAAPGIQDVQPLFPFRAAFYYPWFP